jgi:hypothetical protein
LSAPHFYPTPCAIDDSDVYVDWGPTFFAQHRKVYPEPERPAQTANIGWLGLQLILANGGTISGARDWQIA